jgi:hypothetical protein
VITRYSRPYPQTADQGDCPAVESTRTATRRLQWVCTRAVGHDGDHQAGGPAGQMYASWPAEEMTL